MSFLQRTLHNELVVSPSHFLSLFLSLRAPTTLHALHQATLQWYHGRRHRYNGICLHFAHNDKGSGCLSLTATSVTVLARYCTQLESADLRSVSLSDAAIAALAAGCTRLHTLSFSGRGVTAAGYESLAEGLNSFMRYLCIEGGTGVDAGLPFVLRKCSVMNVLLLSRTDFGDSAAAVLAVAPCAGSGAQR